MNQTAWVQYESCWSKFRGDNVGFHCQKDSIIHNNIRSIMMSDTGPLERPSLDYIRHANTGNVTPGMLGSMVGLLPPLFGKNMPILGGSNLIKDTEVI